MIDREQKGRETPLEIEDSSSPEEIANRLAFAGLILPSQRRLYLPREILRALEVEMSPNEMGADFDKLVRANIIVNQSMAILGEKLPDEAGQYIYPETERYRRT